MKKPQVIVVGGFDPSGGAGVTADLSILQKLNVPALSIVTAITAQNEKKFFSYEAVSSKNFEDQLQSVQPFAFQSIIKIGMLGKGRLIPILFKWIQKTRPRFVILDPLLCASTNFPLIDSRGTSLLGRYLYQADLITPNLSEVEFLSKMNIRRREEKVEAANRIFKKAPKKSRLKWILIK